jgi:L-lactate dehydrogenase (cytochrome)
MELSSFPDLESLKLKCRKSLPAFVWEYLDSGTGQDIVVSRNRRGFDDLTLRTSILRGDFDIHLGATFLNADFKFPVGVSPVGMAGLICPDIEIVLAGLSERVNFPYVLSNMAACSIERLVKNLSTTKNLWFQLYAPKDDNILADTLSRANEAGISTLVVTVDLPGASVRERLLKSGMKMPPRLSVPLVLQCLSRPRWSASRLIHGMPRMENLEKYSPKTRSLSPTQHLGYQLRTNPDWSYIKRVRELWSGNLILKGISSAQQLDAICEDEVDAIWVSNHGGRQFDAHKSAITVLPEIRQSTSKPLIFDGGIECALDILKAYSQGADYVMAGRAWHYAAGALGQRGPKHLSKLLARDLEANLRQIGVPCVTDLKFKG